MGFLVEAVDIKINGGYARAWRKREFLIDILTFFKEGAQESLSRNITQAEELRD